MAVYEQTYKRFEGALTPEWSRFLVLPRYAFRDVFKSRMFLVFFVVCFLAPFAGLLLIYLHHNLSALKVMQLDLSELQNAIPIDETFFYRGLGLQGFLAFVLVVLVGPALVAPDLRNNGLALYLSRPFSRAEYVLGKGFVLVALLSLITWIPGLLLFFFQSYLDGAGWLGDHLGLAWAIFAGSWVWILFLTLLALAVSAWVKWKPVARISLLVVFFVLRGFAAALNQALGIRWGMVLSASDVINSIWYSLFHQERPDRLPLGAAWIAWAAGCLVCLWLLSRRLRAYEVVR